jgi:hypothetical protein
MSEEPAEVWHIVREILRYLEHHPDAKDTLSGIAQWWLQRQEDMRRHRDIERAVVWLCTHGLILETRRPGVPPYYQRNPQQSAAIAKLLEES